MACNWLKSDHKMWEIQPNPVQLDWNFLILKVPINYKFGGGMSILVVADQEPKFIRKAFQMAKR